MKTLLPLMLAAAAVQVQAASYRPAGSERFSAGLTYADVSHDVVDFDGFTLDASVNVAENIALRLSLTDAGTGGLRNVVGPTTYDFNLDARRFSLGGELKVPFGSSFLGFSLDFAGTKIDGRATDGTDVASGDVADNNQVIAGVRFVQELGAGFSVALGVRHSFNDVSLKNGMAAVYELNDNDTTAPSLSVSWAPVPSFSLEVAYSTEDALLGLPDADGTFTIGARFSY